MRREAIRIPLSGKLPGESLPRSGGLESEGPDGLLRAVVFLEALGAHAVTEEGIGVR